MSNTENRSEVICPYCGVEYEDYFEGYELIEDQTSGVFDEELCGTGTVVCDECCRSFEVYVETRVAFSTYKIEGEDIDEEF